MSEIQNVAIHSQNALSGLRQSVREGDLLFVRVLQNQGGGKYLASFAGGRFSVKSDSPLKAGDTFRAQVKIVNGKVFLFAQNAGGKISGANAISVQNFNFQSPEASAFLASFGLPADGVSQKILQFLMQSGARLDSALMKKARRLAAKFAGREIDAAESALVLEQNGFDSDDSLEEIMALFGGDFHGGEKENPRDENSNPRRENENSSDENSSAKSSDEKSDLKIEENSGEKSEEKSGGENDSRDSLDFRENAILKIEENSAENLSEKKFAFDSKNEIVFKGATFREISDSENDFEFFLRQCAEEINNFFASALGGDFQNGEKNSAAEKSDFQDSGVNDFFGGENFKENFLAFFNHKNLKSQRNRHWIFLPFEFEMNSIRKKGEDALRGVGVFRICMDLEKNLVEKCSVNFEFAGKNLRFVLYFKNKEVCRVIFSSEGGADFASESAENLARLFGEGVEVCAISPEEFSAFGTEDFPLSSVEGFA